MVQDVIDSANAVMTDSGDMVYFGTERTRLAKSDNDKIMQLKSGLPSWQTVASGDENLAYIGEVKLGSPAEYLEQATGFDTYSNVMIFFNLREVSGTFIPMCQFYSGGSLQTGTSYGLSECIDGGSVSKTNGTTKVMLDGNTDDNSSCVGYMSLYTAEDNAPSNYSCVQGQYQLGLGGTSNAPDVQVQFCAKYTTAIEGIRFTDEGSNAEFGTDTAFKMFGVTKI